MSVLTLRYHVFRNIIVSIVWAIKWITSGLSRIKAFMWVKPVIQANAQIESGNSLLRLLWSTITDWGSSLVKKIFYGLKSIYNFVVYMGCEIGKH